MTLQPCIKNDFNGDIFNLFISSGMQHSNDNEKFYNYPPFVRVSDMCQ